MSLPGRQPWHQMPNSAGRPGHHQHTAGSADVRGLAPSRLGLCISGAVYEPSRTGNRAIILYKYYVCGVAKI